MSPRQLQVLEAMGRLASPGYFTFYSGIAEEAGLGVRETRLAVRALVRAGLAERSVVFDEATGLAAGSGHAITKAGQDKLDGRGL